jgi:hypothetical protein
MPDKQTIARRIVVWSKAVFTPLALAFIGYFFWINRDTLVSVYSEGSPGHFFLVVFCWVVLHFVSPLFTCLAMQSMGVTITYRLALEAHISRLPAKYLPGGIWHSVARAADYRGTGIASGRVLTYLVLENLVVVAITLGIGGAFAMLASSSRSADIVIGAAMLAAWLLIFLLPRLSRSNLLPGDALSGPAYFRGIFVVAAYWCLAGASFAVFVTAFPDLQISTSPLVTGGIYLFSWGVGYLAVFAPQGLGVSELVSGLLLGGEIELGGMIIILLGFRLLMAVADIATWSMYAMYSTRMRA